MKKTVSFLLLAAMLGTLTACKDKSEVIEVPETTAEFRYGEEVMNYDYTEVDFAQYMDIPELSSIKVSQATVDEEWAAAVDIIRYENITFTEADADDVAELGDEVNIHYLGTAASYQVELSAETLAGMTNYEYDENGELMGGFNLTLGSGDFIPAYESKNHPEKNNPGFEEQLLGAKVGDKLTITVTFPNDYGVDELNGLEANFDVTINSLRKGSVPELTDAMVATFTEGDYTTIEGLKGYVTSYHKESLAYPAVTEAFTVNDYPQAALDSAIARYVQDYISINYDKELTEEETRAVYNEQYKSALKSAKETVSERMILEYLFKTFNISLSQEEYTKLRDADYAENAFTYLYYYDITSVDEFESTFGKDALMTKYKQEKLRPLLPDAITFE